MSTADDLRDRLRAATLAAFEVHSVALGYRLGLYQTLHLLGNANPGELAQGAGTDSRYTREWLEQQAVAGLIAVWEQSASPDGRRYALIPGTESILTDRDGSDRAIHDVRSAVAAMLVGDKVESAFRDGSGLPFSAFGLEMLEGQSLGNKAEFDNLGSVWMPAMPDVHEHLLGKSDARIAEIGFGSGWSTIALARTYPNARIDGLELDAASVDLATRNAIAAGVGDRVRFVVQDAADSSLSGVYDFAFAFECIHDMTQPVPALRALRNLVGPGGPVLIGEDLVEEAFSVPGTESERMTYGWSVFHCLPVGMDSPVAVGTGAMMRDAPFRSYCAAAGFTEVTRLPLDHTGWRFYRLTG
jgi:2-polyprenyl-3-methyl-5-hydroxy-6-metoxy-1,4-benzoquinol methylase